MSALLREQGIQTVHDQVVSQVAQRWAKAFQCKVTIKTDVDQNPWADALQQADIVGWYFTPRGNSLEWVAEVETGDSIVEPDIGNRWQQAALPGVPIYLFIPRGHRADAEEISVRAGINFNSVYEYTFVNGVAQIL